MTALQLFSTPIAPSDQANKPFQITTTDVEKCTNGIVELMETAKTEEGILHYCIVPNTKDSTKWHVFERYQNKAAFDKHMAQEWVAKFTNLGIISGADLSVCRPPQKSKI